ncbi:hypothetical protein ENBRE01_3124 [Enteropsectra breve]|nr:hypothetical protein ENBRE01_3124 [Enteropsectra breve]
MSRKSYTLKDKLNALIRLKEEDRNISKVAREFGITAKMLREWEKNEENLLAASHKKDTRHIGSGRKPLWPDLEIKLREWLYTERSVHKRIVTFNTLRRKALKFASDLNLTHFRASNCWLGLFMKRNGLSSRKITSIGQEDSRPIHEIRAAVQNYFEAMAYKLNGINNLNNIINMDETPVYIDMMATRTISFKGEKNTEALGTGHNKTRLTVVLAITASGRFLKTMVILKGLKKVPKCKIPSNIVVKTNKTGTMNKHIMLDWIRLCLNQSGPFRNNEEKLLLLDSFGSHKDDSVIQLLETENTKSIFIPPKTTSFLQPLDVLVNAIFKASMKQQWSEWLINGPQEFTKSGYRKKPSWEYIFNAISTSINNVSEEFSKKSFLLCGIFGNNIRLEASEINSKLSTILYSRVDDDSITPLFDLQESSVESDITFNSDEILDDY